jgi:hypothetical protein
MKQKCVRKTVSIPADLAAWAEEHARDRGHEMLSRAVVEALKHLRKAQERKLRGVAR